LRRHSNVAEIADVSSVVVTGIAVPAAGRGDVKFVVLRHNDVSISA